MAKKAKTLSDIGSLTNPEPEVPEVAETAAKFAALLNALGVQDPLPLIEVSA